MDSFANASRDRELLRAFVDTRDERCFELLVKLYLGLVYGLAIRRTRDAELADEVTQNVFILLARKSSKLTSHPTLGGWLAKSAANESARLTRNERTRLQKMKEFRRDQAAASGPQEGGNAAWLQARPLLLSATMKAKLTTTTIVLAALAISTGGGWLAGNLSRGAIPITSLEIRGDTSSAATGAVATQAIQDARRESLRELLDTARNELQGHATMERASIRAAARLSLIQPEDFPEAVKLLSEFDGGFQANETLAGLLLEQWAAHDGRSACEFALKHMNVPLMGLHPVGSSLRAWASQAPEASMAWFQEHKNAEGQLVNVTFGEWGQISDVRWIMGAWALKDPAGAARAYRQLETAAERSGARIGIAELAKRSPDRGILLDAIWDTPDHPGKPAGDEVSTVLGEWAQYHPGDLAEWIDGHAELRTRNSHVTAQVLGQWLVEDSTAAIEWWMNEGAAEKDRDKKIAGLIEAWAEADVYTAAEWLANQNLTDAHARAVRTLSQKLSREDPERAFAWAQVVPQERERESALRSIYPIWHRKAPVDAEAALKSANIDEALRAKLEQSVKD